MKKFLKSVCCAILTGSLFYVACQKDEAQKPKEGIEKIVQEDVSIDSGPCLMYHMPKKLSSDLRDVRFQYNNTATKEEIHLYYGVDTEEVSLRIEKETGIEMSVRSILKNGKRQEFYEFLNREKYLINLMTEEQKKQMVVEAEERFKFYMTHFSGIISEVRNEVLKYKNASKEFEEFKKKLNIRSD